MYVTILPLEPTGPPTDFRIDLEKTTSQSISLSWSAVLHSDKNGIITGYKVVYQALPSGGNYTVNVGAGNDDARTSTTLSGLKKFTNYSISVLAFTVKGDGPPSPSRIAQTKEDSKLYRYANQSCRNFVNTLIFGMQFVPNIYMYL